MFLMFRFIGIVMGVDIKVGGRLLLMFMCELFICIKNGIGGINILFLK